MTLYERRGRSPAAIETFFEDDPVADVADKASHAMGKPWFRANLPNVMIHPETGEEHRTGLVSINPELANTMLKANFELNRNLKPLRVELFQREIEAGRFHATGQLLIFDELGYLIDGQHRLTAIVKAGRSAVMGIYYGVSIHVRPLIDQGIQRSGSDSLHIAGYKAPKSGGNATDMAAAIRIMRVYDGRTPLTAFFTTGLLQISGGETRDLYFEKYKDAWFSTVPGKRAHLSPAKLPTSVGIPLHYLFSKAASKGEADQFFAGLSTGENLSGITLVLRNRLLNIAAAKKRVRGFDSVLRTSKLNSSVTRKTYLALVVTTWNHVQAGRNPSKLVVPRDDVVPAIESWK